MRAPGTRGLWLSSLALIAIGILLLLNNFLLLSGFDAATLWPLLLVVAGASILLRGDLLPGGAGRPFSITRGSVESAALEISAAEIDVQVGALAREDRLVTGQFAAEARPTLDTHEAHAHLKMFRAATPWLSFAPWSVRLAQDLPWQVYITTSVGQIQLDLTGVVVQNAVVASGIGDIRVVCPQEALGTLRVQSALGNIHILTPVGCNAQIQVAGSPVFRVHADSNRYEQVEPGLYTTRDADAHLPVIVVQVRGTFGDAYLA